MQMRRVRKLFGGTLGKLAHLVRWRQRWVVGMFTLTALLTFSVPIYALITAHGRIYSVSTMPSRNVAIVFGAGVYPDGKPTPFLESRLLAAITLYREGGVHVLLLSGDNRTVHYNEPLAMKAYVIARGVPAKAVVLDYAGYDTYDTCYRAHALFGVTTAILVTHTYHLPRALFTCNAIGIKSIGVKADRTHSNIISFDYFSRVREVLSIDKTSIQLIFRLSPHVMGSRQPGVTDALTSWHMK